MLRSQRTDTPQWPPPLGCATNEIMRRAGLSESAVWRCQERTRKMALSDEAGKS